MILAGGKLYDSAKQNRILNGLEKRINRTMADKKLLAETVIEAFDRLGRELSDGIECTGSLEKALGQISAEMLRYRIRTELGPSSFQEERLCPPGSGRAIRLKTEPLGTLFHITAGNADGLPVFSALEGLLTGNINLLKLPSKDDGVSLWVLHRLTQIEPQLKEFLYVFDTPSSDERALQRMAQLADGIVVWGGDEAVASIRRLAPAGARLIEWGEKLGFAYLSGFRDKDTELKELAEHIISTKQLLCSSCQTIFLDTYRMEEVWHFCGEFLPYLEAAAKSRRQESPARIAEETLWSYHRYLEQILKRTEYRRVGKRAAACDTRIFGGHRCSLTACRDSRLELSGQFGHCLVKRLPKEQLVSKLRREKGRLQTAGLICPEEKRTELTELLARCGVTRITTAGAMSEPLGGESHDGEYPLRRYVRLVSIEE